MSDPRGSRGFSVRASDGVFPPPPLAMLAVRIGPWTAWGLTPHTMRSLAGRSANEPPVSRGHGQEAKRGQPDGPRLTRNGAAMGLLLLPCVTTRLSLIAVWCVIGATPRGQPWTPAVARPHVRDGLSVRRIASRPCKVRGRTGDQVNRVIGHF